MTTAHHTPYPLRGPLSSDAMSAPLGQLDAAIVAVDAALANVITSGSGATTTLTAQANSGQKNMVVASGANFPNGAVFWIGDAGGTKESGIIASGGGTTTLVATTNLANTYAIGKPVSISPVELVDARGNQATLGTRLNLFDRWAYDVRKYGATGDGTTDDKVAIQAAIDAAEAASGGIVFFPPGNYKVSAQVLVQEPNISLVGASARASIITSTSTADAIRFHANPWTVEQFGRIESLTIEGNANASAVGIHLMDTTGVTLADVAVRNFTGATAVGVWLENTDHWTERTEFSKVHLDGNKVGLKCSVSGTGTNSFAFTRMLDLRCNVNNGQSGIMLMTTASMNLCVLNATFNVVDAGIVLDIRDTASISRSIFNLVGEQTSGTGGIGIKVASGAACSGAGVTRFESLPHSNLNPAPSTNVATLRILTPESGPTATAVPPAFRQDHGTFPAFQGSAGTGYPIAHHVDRIDSPQGYTGIITGDGIISPYVAMYGGASNAFVVYATLFQRELSASREVFKVNPSAVVTLNVATAVIPEIAVTGTDANIDLLIRPKGTGLLSLSYAQVAAGGGAAPTFTTIGGSGPATAAQSGWLKVKVGGNNRFIPIWA